MIDYFIDYVEENKSGMPEFLEFALSIGVTRRTLTNWKKEHKEFEEAYALCNDIQQWYLERMGLSGRNNPRMTQFLLSVKHQCSEYARRKPSEERQEAGLSEGDRILLAKIEQRLSEKEKPERAVYSEGATFGEFPYGDERNADGGA